MVQFAKDIEVFSVAPPALDDIHRWLRDRSKQTEEQERLEIIKSSELNILSIAQFI